MLKCRIYYDAETGNQVIRELRRVIEQITRLCGLKGTDRCNHGCPAWKHCEGEIINAFRGNFARAATVIRFGKFVNGHGRLGRQKVYRRMKVGPDYRWRETLELSIGGPQGYKLATRIWDGDQAGYLDEYQQRFFEFYDYQWERHCNERSLTDDQKHGAAAG
ncbi:MAG: hypothetical protein ACLFUU_12935 [Desulfobacteraceae bacterium]